MVGLMVHTFARVGAVISMQVEDYFVQGQRGWGRLHEKGGKEHEMPAHHNLDRYLEEYIAAAGIAQDRKGPLFRTTNGRSGELTQIDLARATSVSQPMIAHIEQGLKQPSVEMAERIAAATQIRPEFLFRPSGPTPPLGFHSAFRSAIGSMSLVASSPGTVPEQPACWNQQRGCRSPASIMWGKTFGNSLQVISSLVSSLSIG